MSVTWQHYWVFGLVAASMFLSLACLCMVSWAAWYCATERRREARRRLELLRGGECLIEASEDMSDAEFAWVLAEHFHQAGYSTRTPRIPGKRQEVGLLLRKDGRSIAVRAKRYAESVGDDVAQEWIASLAFCAIDEAWLLTTSSFTREARELADRAGVRLIDGTELEAWVAKKPDEEGLALVSESDERVIESEVINEARKRAFWHPHPDSEP